MRKVYIFERLTGQVKRLAAFMLITLLAVGNVFAQEVTYVFSEQGYENAQDLVAADFDNVISFTPASNGASNTPKYYTSGNAGRFYGQNSFVLTPAMGYVITGVTFKAPTSASYSPNLEYTIDGAETPVSLTPEVVGSNKVYTINDIQANLSVCVTNPNSSGHVRVISITVTYAESDVVVVPAPTFSIPSGTYYTEQTVSLTAAPGANIFYSINGGEPILYNDPFTVSTTSTISAYAVLGEDISATATVTITLPVQLANIAALMGSEADNSTLYQITGDVQCVWRHGKNMFVQDATGGLYIYDDHNKISAQYNNGDVISGGIFGTLKPYNGMAELVPTVNTAEGTPGAAIEPIVTTIADIEANPTQYMYKLVALRNGSFQGKTITTGNSAARTIEFYQGGDTIKVYNQFNTVNATFAANEPGVVVGFVGKFENNNGSYFEIFPRDNADLIGTAAPYA